MSLARINAFPPAGAASHPVDGDRLISGPEFMAFRLAVHASYPDSKKWLVNKVLPDLRVGARKVLSTVTTDAVNSVCIVKFGAEPKICSLWVDSRYRRLGLASFLIRKALASIGDSHPLFTIPENMLMDFEGILRRLKFSGGKRLKNFYRVGDDEIVFNGDLK